MACPCCTEAYPIGQELSSLCLVQIAPCMVPRLKRRIRQDHRQGSAHHASMGSVERVAKQVQRSAAHLEALAGVVELLHDHVAGVARHAVVRLIKYQKVDLAQLQRPNVLCPSQASKQASKQPREEGEPPEITL